MSKKIHKIIYHVSVLYVIKLLNNQNRKILKFHDRIYIFYITRTIFKLHEY